MFSKRLFTQIRCMCKNGDKYRQVPKIENSVRGAFLFNEAFGKYLFLTNTLSSGALMAIGDLAQQEIEFRKHSLDKRYDWMRLTRMFIIGLSMGPLHHYFYKYLDNYLPKRNIFSITKKIFMDQLLMSPVCIGLFFYGMGLMEGKNMSECTDEINGKFVEVYVIRYVVCKNGDKYRQVSKIAKDIRGALTFNPAFGKYLLLTNTVTSCGLMALGDIIQQEFEFRNHTLKKRYDWMRLTRMTLFGLAQGPVYHNFYKYLQKYLPERNIFSTTKKIMIDQLVLSPILIASFFYGMGFMEGKNMSECNDEMKGKFFEVYLIDWSIWPPTQFLNFYFLPVQYQVLYINVVTMVYNVFLSYIKHREIAQEIRGNDPIQ